MLEGKMKVVGGKLNKSKILNTEGDTSINNGRYRTEGRAVSAITKKMEINNKYNQSPMKQIGKKPKQDINLNGLTK